MLNDLVESVDNLDVSKDVESPAIEIETRLYGIKG